MRPNLATERVEKTQTEAVTKEKETGKEKSPKQTKKGKLGATSFSLATFPVGKDGTTGSQGESRGEELM